MSSLTVWTVGHGARPLGAFLDTVSEAGIATLADVRRYPASRRHPHFSRSALERALSEAGIAYEWWGETLGGRRPTSPASRQVAWRQRAFRGYADHMETAAFQHALVALESRAAAQRLAIMCAETLWWRCHRRLIADALVARGATVVHLMGDGKSQEHRLHEAARLENGELVYDVGVESPLF